MPGSFMSPGPHNAGDISVLVLGLAAYPGIGVPASNKAIPLSSTATTAAKAILVFKDKDIS
jgi:hypothetical protein